MDATMSGAGGPAMGVAPGHIGSAKAVGRLADRVFVALLWGCGIFVLILLGLIIAMLFEGGLPAFRTFGLDFLWTTTWNPVTENFGALVMIYGTLFSAVIAVIIALPLSFGIAFFLSEIAPQSLRRPVGVAIQLLAAVPSIIYGMWGFFIISPLMAAYVQPPLIDLLGPLPVLGALFQGPALGGGMLTAGLIMAVMILPFITAMFVETLASVPPMLKESAYGLGSTTWEVVWKVVLPYTKTGVVGGVMLGLGRALGETMAVTFVIGNMNQLSSLSVFEAANSITSALANEFAEAGEGLHQASLIYLGLVLFFITFVVLACSKVLLNKLKKNEGARA